MDIDRRGLLGLGLGAGLGLCGVAPAHAAEPGVGEREVLLGQCAAFTGPAAQLGLRLRAGIESHFKHLNARGGIAGRTLRLAARDDGYEPERTREAVRALLEDDKVFALVGTVGTPTTLAALPAIRAAGVPLVGPFTGAPALREPVERLVFHVRAGYADETERIVQHLATLGIARIAVFHQNDAYGQAGLAGVKAALQRRGGAPVAVATVERNSVEVGPALATLLAAQPEAVVQVGAYAACAAFIRQARDRGWGGQFFNVSFVGARALADALGPQGAGVVVSQVVPFPMAPNLPVVREYQAQMGAAGDTAFDFTSLEGWLVARVTAEGLRRAGRGLTRESFIAALETLRGFDAGGFRLDYGPGRREGSGFTELTMLGRDGRFVR